MKRLFLILSGLLLGACTLGPQPDLPSVGGLDGTGGSTTGLPGDGGGARDGCGPENSAGAGGLGGDGSAGAPSAGSCGK